MNFKPKVLDPRVDDFLNTAEKWQKELRLLRSIVFSCGLTEEFKWKHPCYTYQGKNVVLIHGFKNYCALLFYKGALLKDTEGILVQQTKNVQAGRQIRFTSAPEIANMEATLKAYIFEAIELEKAGVKVPYKKTADFTVPEELQTKFKNDPAFKTAFKALTPGRQKGYLLHFSQAKQTATRKARIEKYTSRILNGKGINDCVCGHSKRMPNCDGSHKHLSKKS